MQGCDCCVSADDQRRLRGGTLRTVGGEDLTRFAFKAMTTWGTVEDYKHYLPRILELAATPEGRAWPGMAYHVILDKLEYGAAGTWPAVEQQALAAYWDAALRATLDVADYAGLFAETLQELLPVRPDVASVLAHLAADERPSAVIQTASLVLGTAPQLHRVGRLHAWPDAPETAVLEGWLREPARIEYLEAAFVRMVEAPEAADIAEAADLLRWLVQPP